MSHESVLHDLLGVSTTIAARATKNESYKVECKLCAVKLESLKTWEQHLDSKRHRTNTKSRGLNEKGFPVNAAQQSTPTPTPTPTPTTPTGTNSDAGGIGAKQNSADGMPKPRSQASDGGGLDLAKTLTALGAKVGTAPTAVAPTPSASFKTFAKSVAPAKESPVGPAAVTLKQTSPPSVVPVASSNVDKSPFGSKQPTILQRPATAVAHPQPAGPGTVGPAKGQLPTQHTATLNATSAGQPQPVVMVNAVNANKAAGKFDSVVVVEPTPGIPLLDPASHRQKVRNASWLATTKTAEVSTPVGDPAAYQGNFKLHVNLYKVLTGTDGAAEALSANAKIKAAWDAIIKDIKFESVGRDGSFVTVRTAERISLSQMRSVETLLLTATYLAAYDDHVAASVPQQAKIDSNFWGS